ncbi:hypothetical protein B0A69_16040 [Chryseobacterium shigense]|uniref:Uncharacterized protein n=1 Tax=Chryseobacterium shigense TaxID=297244 RepID=A0A1N7HVX2_9FLAO|nr:hypothetical protein [Chryseobacterium shigense]PQA91931.1 hypothetical protein B0A69_16040 [Chryseobacterium shigense]SIS29004.1 hypothetical protein SAMN05421639_101331 [Chryseobacterium shigense]
MKKEILKHLRSDYERLEIKPSEDLWDRLDEKLDEASQIPLKPSFQWWKYAAVIVLLISMGTFIYFNQYKTQWDDQKEDYIVEKTVKPMPAELQNPSIISNNPSIEENKVKMESKDAEKNHPAQIVIPKISDNRVAENKVYFNTPDQPEKAVINQEKIENTGIMNAPVIAEVKQSNYINPDELLLGREFDKAREKSRKDDRKLGAFKFDNVVPNVGNVTVLGVTVYLESK